MAAFLPTSFVRRSKCNVGLALSAPDRKVWRFMSRLLKSSGAVGTATLISRVLGFAREAVYAGFMGVGMVSDAFYYALTIPNLFRRLLGEGALTAAFIPIFKEKEKNEGEAAMWHASNAVISGLIVICAALVVFSMIVITGLVEFVPMEMKNELILRLLRVMFPYLGLACIAAVFIGMLNARGQFFLPALGAASLNLVMIGSVWWLAPRFGVFQGQQVFGLAWGLLIAGAIQAAVQWPSLRKQGYRFVWVNPFTDPTVRRVLQKMGPATLGVAAYQINVVLTQTIAVHTADNIVSSFNYAVRLMELPQGVVGVSLATYLLTELSGLAVEKKFPEFRKSLQEGVLQLIFINALATGLLLVLAEPMIRLLFEHGSFHADHTTLCTVALRCLAPGLIAFSMNNILARAFYALGDTKTPMRISIACLTINLILGSFMIPGFQQAGMGIANTLSAIANTVLLGYALRKALPKLEFASLLPNAAAVAGATLLACLTAWGTNALWESHFGHKVLWTRAGAVFVPMILATLVYGVAALFLKLPQFSELRSLISRRRRPAPQTAAPVVAPKSNSDSDSASDE